MNHEGKHFAPPPLHMLIQSPFACFIHFSPTETFSLSPLHFGVISSSGAEGGRRPLWLIGGAELMLTGGGNTPGRGGEGLSPRDKSINTHHFCRYYEYYFAPLPTAALRQKCEQSDCPLDV